MKRFEKVKMGKRHNVQKVEFLNNEMRLEVDGKEFSFQLADISKRLPKASKLERETFKISPSGYGIHWPLIDEDLSIPGLLKNESVSRKRKIHKVTETCICDVQNLDGGLENI